MQKVSLDHWVTWAWLMCWTTAHQKYIKTIQLQEKFNIWIFSAGVAEEEYLDNNNIAKVNTKQ